MARKDSEKPKEVIQSYLVTSARYDFNVHEKRILYRIVELIQCELKGQPLGQGVSIQPNLYDESKTITMPIRRFLKRGEEDKNHYSIKKAFNRLNNIVFEEETERYWRMYRLVDRPKIDKYGDSVTFILDQTLYQDLLNFAKGYSQYELQVAFNFQSQYTMRFYELISRQSRPSLTFAIDTLREMFMLEDRYKLNRDFIKRVIDPAQKELEASNAPYYFTYEKIKIGRAFRNVQLNIHYRPQYDKNTHKRVSIGWDIERNFLRKLEEVFGQEVNWKPHKELLVKAQDLEPEILVKILRGSQKASNPVGYFINALKRQLNNPGR